jgi:hypothetical protein
MVSFAASILNSIASPAMEVLAEFGSLDLVHHLHRRHEALDVVVGDRKPAGPGGDGLDHAVAGEDASCAGATPDVNPKAVNARANRTDWLILSFLNIHRFSL